MTKYICGVDFQHELEHGAHFYNSLEGLKNSSQCWEECGIVRVEFDGPDYPKSRKEIKSYEWIVEQNLFRKDPKANKESGQ